MTQRAFYGAIAFLAILAGCGTTSVLPEPDPSPQALAALQQARDAYDAGQYGEVIRTVARSRAIDEAPSAERVEALKLLAFSYCVTDHRGLCQDTFTRILRTDPAFELAPAEAGHPQWGPVFQAAKAAQAR